MFHVYGTPVPQGSMRTVGRGVVIHSNAAKLNEWRTKIAAACVENLTDEYGANFDGHVYVSLSFVLRKPKSVKRARPTVRPDIDKLCRAVLDGITMSGVIRDDAQVVSLFAFKFYETHPGTEGVNITVGQFDE